MAQATPLFAYLRLIVADPVAAGRALLALDPPLALRWTLLAAMVLASVVLLYLMPALAGTLSQLPTPFAFAALQAATTLFVVALVTYVGRGFGGTGTFADALWLMGWAQLWTVLLLLAQIATMLVLPILEVPVALGSVVLSLWILVGFICALHGFRSRFLVLTAGFMVFTIASFVLAAVLVLLGFNPSELTNV